jgi:hypothetical protein
MSWVQKLYFRKEKRILCVVLFTAFDMNGDDKVEMGLLMYEPLPVNRWGSPYI